MIVQRYICYKVGRDIHICFYVCVHLLGVFDVWRSLEAQIAIVINIWLQFDSVMQPNTEDTWTRIGSWQVYLDTKVYQCNL